MTPRCGHCGYNLTGAPGNRCPECGKLFIEAGVVVRDDLRRGRWRFVLPLIAFALLVGTIGVSYFAVRAAQARAAAERARAAAVTAFLRQSPASQPWQWYVPSDTPTTLPAMLLPSERNPHPIPARGD
ncbi:MAG: hypothetical protein IT450_05680 [Phycisphaerales bacterium]|nr:hypothetical protein [Phycisphaerales bacterium]